MFVCQDEVSLLRGVVGAVQSLDPDILVGWDMQRESLGYLVDRWASASPSLFTIVGRAAGVIGLPWAEVGLCFPFLVKSCGARSGRHRTALGRGGPLLPLPCLKLWGAQRAS